MNKLFENWRRYLKEEVDQLQAAREIISKNTYLQRYADELSAENLVDAGQYVFLYLPDTFKHAKTSHMRDSDLPGSKFSDAYLNDQALVDLVVELLTKKSEPNEVDPGPFGTKLKWFNVEMGKDIGEDSIIHKSKAKGKTPSTFDYREKIGNNRAIPAIMKQGLKVLDADGNELSDPEQADPEGQYIIQQDVPVIDGPLQPTDKLNLIVGEIGDLGGKKLISLVTMYPGVSEPKAMNKKDYAELGYYFLSGK